MGKHESPSHLPLLFGNQWFTHRSHATLEIIHQLTNVNCYRQLPCCFVHVFAIQWDRSTSSILLCQGAILSFPPAQPMACVLPTLPFNATSANKHVFLKLGESGLKHVNCHAWILHECCIGIPHIVHIAHMRLQWGLSIDWCMLQCYRRYFELWSSLGVTEPWPMQRKEWIASALHHLSLQQRAEKHWNNLIATIWTCINHQHVAVKI